MKISRRSMLGSCVGAGLALASDGAFAGESKQKRPNIVFILMDDIGYECLGAYGSKQYKTPNFDALAKAGAMFTHAYAQPLCTPSRVQLLTGKYNFRNYTNFGTFNFSEPTFAKLLKSAGYATCIAGKWQLSPADLEGPHKAGFDEYLLWHFSREGMKSTLKDEFTDKGSRYKSPKLYRNGKLVEHTEGKYGPDLCADFICEFIEKNRDKPFLAYYPTMLVHEPYQPTPESADWEKGGTGPKYFPDMVAHMDMCIGRVVDTLDKLGLRENTLILVTGDNGTGIEITSTLPGVGEIKGGKGSMTDAGTRVGFAAVWPGHIKAGTVVSSPIDFTDVMPTMADAAGLPIPSYADGQSLLPVIAGDKDKTRGWVFMSYVRDLGPGNDFKYFVRDERWKLYRDGSLYDVDKDPEEKTVATGPEAEVARKKLQPIMDRILKK